MTSFRPAGKLALSVISREVLKRLVEKGILAPSGDNLQPWKFRVGEDRIELSLDSSRISEILDVGYRGPYLSVGAVIENIVLAGSHEGYSAQVDTFPQGEASPLLVATLSLMKSDAPEDPLYRAIELRATNRKFYSRKAIPEEIVQELIREGTVPDRTRLRVVQSGKEKAQLGRLIGSADQLRFEMEEPHREFFSKMRWTKQEAEHLRDGIDSRTMELGSLLPFFRSGSRWNRQRLMNRLGSSFSINLYSQLQVRGSPLLGLLVSEGSSPQEFVEGGRVMQERTCPWRMRS